MEYAIGRMLQNFEKGNISRRQLIQGLTAVASGTSVVDSIPLYGQTHRELKAVGINHLSYTVANYVRTRDFYSSLLGAKVAADEGTRCSLHVGDVVIVARNSSGGPTPLIDHVAFSINDWKQDTVFAELTRRGLNPQRPPSGSEENLAIKDPDGFMVQLMAPGHR
jgi:catechol 2,3-dioxygenase-like lactoylglutathione lyase family enzyme